VALEPGYTVFVAPMEEHQFTNTGEEVLRFVCLIPLMEQGEGLGGRAGFSEFLEDESKARDCKYHSAPALCA
jgi:hypothetical protein